MTKRDWNGEFFKSEDFYCSAFSAASEKWAASIANAILREEIAKLETVYIDTHQAKLLPPKEIEK